MDYVTRRILEGLFGKDPLKFSTNAVSPVVAKRRSKNRLSYYGVEQIGVSTRQLSKTFWQLRQQEIIDFLEDKEGNIQIVLTEAGERKVLAYHLDNLTLKTPKHWDGYWRIVAFDIPERKKRARDALTQKMKKLGLMQFQKSLWIYPHECKNEIDFVAQIFEVGKYVHYIVAKNITNETLIRGRFGL
ncbi:MAG: hypothetical protein AAB642_03935 [Patescibacteria group bacterium]